MCPLVAAFRLLACRCGPFLRLLPQAGGALALGASVVAAPGIFA